jgi:hypothetical protein
MLGICISTFSAHSTYVHSSAFFHYDKLVPLTKLLLPYPTQIYYIHHTITLTPNSVQKKFVIEFYARLCCNIYCQLFHYFLNEDFEGM